MGMDIRKVMAKLEKQLTPQRLRHSIEVAEIAGVLAIRYGVGVERAKLAGLLHDYARDLPRESLLKIAEDAGLIGCSVDRLAPDLLHGPVAAWLLPLELEIEDLEIRQAIAVHTLGAENMSRLDKIIYLADLIEPSRCYPGVEHLRWIVQTDLDQALLAGFNQTLKYCIEGDLLLHPQTIDARNYLLQKQTTIG